MIQEKEKHWAAQFPSQVKGAAFQNSSATLDENGAREIR
jgi:hypothetical protein